MRAPSTAATAGLVLLSVLLVGTLWVIPYLPTNDGPEAVLAVHIENHFADPGTLYRDVFQPAPQFAGRGFTVLFEPLEELFGWQRGLQVALSIVVLTQAWGLVALVWAVDHRRLPLAFLGFPLALSWCLYMGFFPFVFASGVGLFVLAFALSPAGPGRRAVLATLLLLQCFMHMFAAILTGTVIAVTLVLGAPHGRRLRELGKVILTGTPAGCLAIAAFLVAHRSALAPEALRDFYFASLHDTLLTWPRTVAPGPISRALLVTAFVTASAALAVLRIFRRATDARDRAFSIVAVVFLLTALFGPYAVPGWQLFSQRFVWLGVCLLVVTLPFERLEPFYADRYTAFASFAAALVLLAFSYPFHRRLAAASADAIAALSAEVEHHGVFLPVTLEPNGPPLIPQSEAEVPVLAPLRHIGSLYAAALGGLIPYTFANNPATWPFTLRTDAMPPPPVPPQQRYMDLISSPEFHRDAAVRQEIENQLATYGMYYEGVVLTGARPDDIAVWKGRGFVADWERGSVMLAHFQPCKIDVAMPDGAPAALLDLGVDASALLRDREVPPVVDARGGRHLVVDGPCGHVWVRPHWDVRPEGRVTFCSNAAPTGEIAAAITRTHSRVDCAGMRTASAP